MLDCTLACLYNRYLDRRSVLSSATLGRADRHPADLRRSNKRDKLPGSVIDALYCLIVKHIIDFLMKLPTPDAYLIDTNCDALKL